MNRRNLFTVIAGALSLAWFKPQPVEVNFNFDTSGLLIHARDILLPGLWSFKKSNDRIQTDIFIDYKHEQLLVLGHNPNNRTGSGFAISKRAILDGRYKAEFAPSVTAMLVLLRG